MQNLGPVMTSSRHLVSGGDVGKIGPVRCSAWGFLVSMGSPHAQEQKAGLHGVVTRAGVEELRGE